MLPVVQEILSSLQEQSAQVLKDSCLLDNQEDPVDSQEMWRMCYMTSKTCLATSWVETGAAGRSGPNDLFPPPIGGFRLGGNGLGPEVAGGRFTYTAGGNLPPRNADDPQGPPGIQAYASPPPRGRALYVISIRAPPDQLARLLGAMFGNMGPTPAEGHANRGAMPQGLQGLFASLLNPANARAGDAVYTQEALDQIISNLMEQNPTSSAPGPASPDAIAALAKLKLDEKLLGPEGKGECTVCMDDVSMGDEVVQLPCSHWFHEPCAAAWLSEHNTCPICRKGIGADANPSPPTSSSNAHSSGSQAPRERQRYTPPLHLRRDPRGTHLNGARLESIQRAGRLSPTNESPGPTRYQVVGDGTGDTRQMPGSFTSPPRRQDSEMSDSSVRDRRGHTSGSDRSRESRRSSGSNSGGGGGGALGWLRNRFGGNNDRRGAH
jgi:E3 ubiquitin-protein ligase RNF115/126